MIIPMPNIMAAMSSMNALPMRRYRSPFVITDGSGGGRCGRARASRVGGCTSFCNGLWSTNIPYTRRTPTYVSAEYTQRMQHHLQRHKRPKERL